VPASFETRLADRYSELSGALRLAADYMMANPVDAATRPLRAVSSESGVSAAAFSRLARALDYPSFENLREDMRTKLNRRVNNFADRAQRMQTDESRQGCGFFDNHMLACQANLAQFAQTVDRTALEAAVSRLAEARRVLLLGALGSTGVVEYLSYMANFCVENWSMAGRMGASLGGGLTGLDARDALIIVTKPPFADRGLRAAELARKQGVYVVLITDSLSCPALKFAQARFIVPTESPHFFSSYMVTLFFVEALIGMVVSRAGGEARERIAQVEDANRTLSEVWDRSL
jgi:DNA-binding MurR/RpiR family transcriptional regulator